MPFLWTYGTADDAPVLAAWNQQLIQDEGHRNRMAVGELETRMRGWLVGEYRAVMFGPSEDRFGYALYRIQPDEIYLRQFFIRRDRRRQGLGRAAFGELRGLWPTDVRLTVEVLCHNTAAIAFWRALGYRDHFLGMELLPAAPQASDQVAN